MNLVEKIKREQEVLASQKAIKTAEKKAKNKEVKQQIVETDNISFAEWFLTEINVGSDMFPMTSYKELVEKKKVKFESNKLYIEVDKIKDTKIASLIYGSSPKDGFLNSEKQYASNAFRQCLGIKSVEKILFGLNEMGVTVITEIHDRQNVSSPSQYELTVISM